MSMIETIDDLMRATYQGNYAARVLGIMPRDFKPTQAFGDMLKSDELRKADDQFTTGDVTYFNPIYGMAAFNWLNLESDIWSLLPKDTFQAKGDSYRAITANASNFHGQLETATALGDTDIPDLTEITVDKPAVMYSHWDSSFIAQMQSTWQDSPKKNAEAFFRDYFAKDHPSKINEWLGKDCDTLAATGGDFDNFIESIDRVCSNAAESAILSAATDNDIYGLDRSAGEAEAYVDLNSGALRDLDLGLLDDMLADCKKYSENKRFIMITDEVQMNTIESLEGVKHRLEGQEKWKIDVKNGVNTRKGALAGFSVSSYIGAGIEVPIFTSKDIHAESGGNGNIYLLDLDEISVRVALPTVYLDTNKSHFLLHDAFKFTYMYLTVAQLVSTRFNCHGAIKWLN